MKKANRTTKSGNKRAIELEPFDRSTLRYLAVEIALYLREELPNRHERDICEAAVEISEYLIRLRTEPSKRMCREHFFWLASACERVGIEVIGADDKDFYRAGLFFPLTQLKVWYGIRIELAKRPRGKIKSSGALERLCAPA